MLRPPIVNPMRIVLSGCFLMGVGLLPALAVGGEPPSVSYIFPAGGQRGTTVDVRVGGHFLYEECPFEIRGPGVQGSPTLKRTKTIWFEGPVIPLPDSQRKEDYPKDQAGQIVIAADAPLGMRYWNVWTSQGVTPAMRFIVGDLPEVIEEEIDGEPLPTLVQLPVTINGRIFPREDVDIWSFAATAGETYTCEVNATRLGSPLEARLEVLDPNGRRVAEAIDGAGADARLHFTAATSGTYQVRIHDINFGGLQDYVYRLTITAGPIVEQLYPLGGQRGMVAGFTLSGQNLSAEPVEIALPSEGETSLHQIEVSGNRSNPFLIELSDLPEQLEIEPNDDSAQALTVSIPAMLNGRIDRPGDVDLWAFDGRKDELLEFEVRASRLGSPLDSVLVLLDSTGRQLARSDDLSGGETDSRLEYKLPADGTYRIQISERVSSRGGPRFAYRLRIEAARPGFRLRLPANAVNLERGQETRLKMTAERLGGFKGPIELQVEGLPPKVTVTGNTIPENKLETQLVLKAEPTARIDIARLQIKGIAVIDEETVTRVAEFPVPAGEPAMETVMLAVAMPTPFKFAGEFETKYSSRGAVFHRHFTLERNGFAGPLEVSLADRQTRHLQGVTGPTITIPPGVDEFDYPVYLPPFMEIGRTSRSVIAVTGVVTDEEGRPHKVSYSSSAQADQIIILVDPGQLSVETMRPSLEAIAGTTSQIEVRIGRGQRLEGRPITLELIVSEHIRGVQARTVEVPANADRAMLPVEFARDEIGPFNKPLLIRATARIDGQPVIAETNVDVIAAGQATGRAAQ